MTTMLASLGVKKESTYGTPVTVDRFFEFNKESIRSQNGRVESRGIRSGTRTLRSDRFEPVRLGAAGSWEFDVPTKGFAFWLEHMLGTVATGSVTDSNYTHTGTEGSLLGDFFTLQLNRPFHPSGTAQAFTYHGGKVLSWQLGCDLDGVLVCTLDCDFEDEDTSTGLASVSYPSDFRVFTWAGGAVTVGGMSKEITKFTVGGNNMLNTDRRFQRASSLKKEPTEDGDRAYTWSFSMDFVDLAEYDRFRASARASTLAAIVGTWDGPIAHGGTTLPRVTATVPAARFDAAFPNIEGKGGITLDVAGIATSDGTNSPVSIAYRSTDSTP